MTALRVALYAAEHQAAARAFNERMRAARAPTPFLLPEKARAPDDRAAPIARRQYLVLDGEEVRGGVIVQEQPHWLGGETRVSWNLQSPLSEGIADRRYGFVAGFLMNELARRNPLLYAVGMGSAALPFPRLLRALRWELVEVPFFFRVCRGRAFLREVRALRSSPGRRILVELAARSGLGPLGLHALQAIRRTRPPGGAAIAEPVPSFGAWADEVWAQARAEHASCAVRDRATLDCLHAGDRLKLEVRLDGKTVGWAVARVRDFRDHKHFGSLRLGMVVDALAPRPYALHVAQAASRALEDLSVDLIVTNQLHPSWCEAFQKSGFLSGPSNYLFGASPALAASAQPGGPAHVNRGDGDGIVNL